MKHVILFTVCLIIISFAAFAQIPNKILYHGMLKTASGALLPDGSYRLKFTLLNNGMPMYFEEHDGVIVTYGVVSVILNPPTNKFANPVFVEVMALSGPPVQGITYPYTFSPLTELVSAPYALYSHSLMGEGCSASDRAVAGGYNNSAMGPNSTICGGESNEALANWSTVCGGKQNQAGGAYSLAAGRRAKASHNGSFVWGDQTDADVSSDKENQFKIRASNGVNLTSVAGSAKTIQKGDYFADNALVAWGKVTATGGVSSKFGVTSVTRNSVGHYTIKVNVTAIASASLVPIAVAECDNPPTSAALARLVTINQIDASTFKVYITNGSYSMVDNDFMFMVTAR
jgi:hypothetical protein